MTDFRDAANKVYGINNEVAQRVLDIVEKGLSQGMGDRIPGHMCVEAAVNFAVGHDHNDQPQCVLRPIRGIKIDFNDDFHYKDNENRGEALRRVAVLQLGSEGFVDPQILALNCYFSLLARYTVPVFKKALPGVLKEIKAKVVEAERAMSKKLKTSAEIDKRNRKFYDAEMRRLQTSWAPDPIPESQLPQLEYAPLPRYTKTELMQISFVEKASKLKEALNTDFYTASLEECLLAANLIRSVRELFARESRKSEPKKSKSVKKAKAVEVDTNLVELNRWSAALLVLDNDAINFAYDEDWHESYLHPLKTFSERLLINEKHKAERRQIEDFAQVLIKMKVPGTMWLDLVGGPDRPAGLK